MKSIAPLALKLTAFAVAMIVVLVGVFRTIERPMSVETDSYTAMFTDANGLRAGDDVRLYGMAVGKVTSIDLVKNQARVAFTLDRSRTLSTDGGLAIRYQTLTGQRYLDVQEPAEPGVPREPGAVIGTSHTVPSFDVTTLFNGLQPVLAELSPAELDKFTTSMLAVVEGRGGGIGPAMDAIGELSRYVTDRQQILSILVRNLAAVSQQIGGKSANAIQLISELTKLITAIQVNMPDLIKFAVMIPPLLDPLDDMLGRIGLIGDPNQPLDALIDNAFPNPDEAVATLNRLPALLQSLAALAPGRDGLRCARGTASTPKEIAVLLGGQRITICNAR